MKWITLSHVITVYIKANFSDVHYQIGFENASLLCAQRPAATIVETYSNWQKKGRYARRGSKGIAIIESEHYRPYADHVFDISDTNGRIRPEIWRLDKEHEKGILVLLHAKSANMQGYVREAVEAEIYGKDKNYIEKICDLCRYHDSPNPEHIYDITKAVIQSAQYMAEIVAGYLEGFYKREMEAENRSLTTAKT